MTCVICKGKKTVIKKDQAEMCENCDGSGEVGENDTNRQFKADEA